MEDHRALYSEHPELKRYTALERYKIMHADVSNGQPPDLSASHALRAAIGESGR
jgi:hypothetical protein